MVRTNATIGVLWSLCLAACGRGELIQAGQWTAVASPSGGGGGQESSAQDTAENSMSGSESSSDTQVDPDAKQEELPEEEGSGSSGEVWPKPKSLPRVTGECPSFTSGVATFRPKGINKARLAQLWVGPHAKRKDGPVVFYWHGAGMNPAESILGLGGILKKVMDLGGVVVAPFHDPEAGLFPWFLADVFEGRRLDDLLLADEILACAIQEIGVDIRRIHTLGFNAGALQSTQMSYRRSSYIASSVAYSGGLVVDKPPADDPGNRFSSMIIHGGPADLMVVPFQVTSERYYRALRENGQFGFICNHMLSHIIPPGVHGSVWRFLQDHPYGVKSPYQEGLPSEFPRYCSL